MKISIISCLLNRYKALLFLMICGFILSFTGCSSGGNGDKETVFVFKNVSVIDAVSGLRHEQTVIVKGTQIVEAGPAKEVRVPSGATVIDCKGKYLIPGLWDAHIHITNTEALRPVMLTLFIVNGITYVRDTGATLHSILPIRKKAEELAMINGMAPRVFMTGPHMDGLQLSWESSVSAVSVEQARFIIDSLINAGVDELKVYDLLKAEVCHEVLSIGRSKGFKVSSHVPLAMDVIEASNAGLSSMEHMYNLEMSCSSEWESLLKARQKMIAEGSGKSGGELRESIYRAQRLPAFKTQDETRRNLVLKTLASNNTWQVPTLAIIAQAEHRIFAREDWQQTFLYLPEPVRSAWMKSAIARTSQTPSEEDLEHARWAYDMIPRLVEAGVGIMAGTDMPLALLTPGFSLHEELALLVRSGLTPLQAIEAATLRPAQYFRLEHQQGSIAKGMMADLVLLDANPLEDINNTKKIWAVMRNGFLHTREKLDETLNQLAK